MPARIYKPAKTAMQSGLARTEAWVLEHEPAAAREIDPLTGWTSSCDTRQQLRLTFETKEAAIAYAERNGIAYTLTSRSRKPSKAYADNFKLAASAPGRTEQAAASDDWNYSRVKSGISSAPPARHTPCGGPGRPAPVAQLDRALAF